MFNPSVNTSNQNKSSGKSGSKSSQKWTVLGDLNQFLASSNGTSARSNDTGASGGSTSSSVTASAGGGADSSHFREAGIIEKLLPSYGFIQCCERQARLFFHYSQFNGIIDHLRLGDAVEFEMTYDKRTGKPIASFVVKISSEAISEEVSAERVTGFITIELVNEKEGRVAYENRGECFFLPFSKDDLEDNSVELRSKDRVTFVIAKDKNGTLRARDIAMETPSPQRFRGLICTLKDSFGFIERTDQVREIFFHSSECAKFKDLEVNDSVEFCIQVRNNKEVAGNVDKLEYGTANFEKSKDVGCLGQILEPVDHSKLHPHLKSAYNSYSLLKLNGYDPFLGKILYRKNGQEIEVALGFREVKYTLQVGDWVRFNITVDTRDQQSYATSVVLLEEDLKYSGEKREHGRVIGLNETGGCIQDMDGCRRYVFDFDELINSSNEIQDDSTVEFTPAENAHGSELPSAIRIRTLNDPYTGSGSIVRKGFISELNQTFNCGVIKLFDQSNSAAGPVQVFFSFSELVSGIVPSVNDRVEFKLHNTAPDVWKAAEVRVIGKLLKAQAPVINSTDSVINSTTNEALNVQLLQHSGIIRVMSRNLGILQSTQLKGQDIFFKVSDLPAQLFPANCRLEYMIDFDSNGLRAYDIRVSDRFADSRQNGDSFNTKSNVEEKNSGETLRGHVFELSRDCGYLRCDDEKKFYFEMSDFPILMVELNAEFEFAVAVDFGIPNYLRAIDLNPTGSGMNGIESKAEREKGFVVSLKKRTGFIQCLNKKGSRLPFTADDLFDPSTALCLNDEVEFEIDQDTNFKPAAVRIQVLPFGTITRNLMAKNQSQCDANGSSNNNNNGNNLFNGSQPKKTPSKFGGNSTSNPNNNSNSKQGFWQSDFQMDSFSSDYSTGNDLSFSNPYGGEDLDSSFVNDFKNVVGFENGEQEPESSSSKFGSPKSSFGKARNRGFIAALKESYGFIESEDLQNEVFFHYRLVHLVAFLSR